MKTYLYIWNLIIIIFFIKDFSIPVIPARSPAHDVKVTNLY